MATNFKGSEGGPLKTLFHNMQAKTDALTKKTKPTKAAAGPVLEENNVETNGVPMDVDVSKKDNKRLSVERIYQKKTQLEHILLRPDTYIGSVESVTQPMWVFDGEANQMKLRDITFVPGLYKIFDEIMVNAADNKQRDPKMDCLKIEIDQESNKIKIWNNGKGIPVIEHKTEKMYVPTMIFGHLLTSSNYDDSEKKVTGGRNGYGAKLCNIFSTKFIVETSAKEYKKAFKQTWSDNMTKTKEPTITDSKESDFTSVTFYPDLAKFKMQKLEDDIVALFTRRAYDIAASSKGVKVFLNGKRVPVKGFKDYVDFYIRDKTDEAGAPLKVIHEVVNDRWEVAVTQSEKGFQQVSFVNSIATTKGGRHVEYVSDQCVTKLIDVVRKKNKGGVNIKPFQVKNHLWVFVNCLIENPTFDSQTKENMTKQAKSFGSKCQLSEKFITQVSKSGIVESILSWMKFKAQAQLNKKCHSSKHSKLKGIPKLDDANNAGTKNSKNCTLILTEGDSAKSLAVAGLSVVGRDNYGVFPLRGKLLNVREATHKQIMDNAEINNIVKIIGLHFKESYDTPEKLSQLRYGKLMIMTDQDQDGSHIKGLLINFVHHFWPSLIKHNFVQQFITPIVKVTKGKNEKSFYSIPEFEEWKNATENWHTYKIKYYKGLGTSTAKEAKEYFTDMQRHKIKFHYGGLEDESSINLAFSKKKIEERKEWLTNHMEEKKRRAEMGLPELYLYGKDTHSISFSDFVNRELILFSNTDLIRSIPSIMDGLKPGQRKVMFTCIKRNLVNKEIKVAQLAGSVAEMSAYHHGEAALMGTIINLAQNFVGSNNLNLLQPLGQFGTRIHGGKDAASPRYIFTMLSTLARHVFNVNDDPLLTYLYDDNQRIEPEWYCPIVPMVLINGADGIGTGWSTRIPNYDVREIVTNLRRMIEGDEPLPMLPKFKNFKGTIEEISAGDNRIAVHGEISVINDTTVEITELPIRTWTQNYKEDVLEPMLHGTEKQPAVISDYKEYHTDKSVRFVVKMSAEKLAQAEQEGLHKMFKISTTMSTNTMVLFNHNGCIKRYEKVEDILQEFFVTRQEYYQRRKDYLEGMLSAESLRLNNLARFIMEKIEGTIVIENKPKKELIQLLVRKGYDSDPVKAWKEAQNKGKDDLMETEEEEEETTGPDFNYILSMALWCLTKEKKDEILKQRDAKSHELKVLQRKTPKDLWKNDLDAFMDTLEEVERLEREEGADAKPMKMGKLGKVAKPKKQIEDTLPSPMGRRIVPKVSSAVKAKGEKDAAKKLFKAKKEVNDDGQTKMSDFVKTEDGSLVSVDGDSPSTVSARGRGRGRGGGGGGRGRGRGAAAAGGAAPGSGKKEKGKKGKKRNPWSSDEESDKDSDISDMDDDGGSPEKVVIPRDTARRAAASKVQYNFDNEEEIESEDDDENGGFKKFDAETGQMVTENGNASDGASDPNDGGDADFALSDDGDTKPEPMAKAKPKAAAPKSKPAAKKRPASDGDDGSDFNDDGGSDFVISDDDQPKPKPKAKPKPKTAAAPKSKPAAQKKVTLKVSDLSDGGSDLNDDGGSDYVISDDDKPKPKAKAKPKAAAAPKAKPAAQKKAPAKSVAKKTELPDLSDSGDEENQHAKALQSNKALYPSSDEDDIIIESSPPPKKAAVPKAKKEKAPAVKKAAPKPKKKALDISDDDSPVKAPVKRGKAKKGSDSDSDSFIPKKKAKAAATKKKAAKYSDGSDDDMDFAAATARATTGRSRTTVKYNYSSDDDDEDFE